MRFFKILITLLLTTNFAFSEQVDVFKFTKEEFDTLQKKKVKGETIWTLGSNDNGNYIKAEAIAAGSGLGKEVKINLNDTPYLNITWKIEKDLENIKKTDIQIIKLMVKHPGLILRPIIITKNKAYVGKLDVKDLK